MWLAVVRLTALFAAIGLATSRVGLVVHELGGHGGTAVAFGGEITDFRLFWFAGGWIQYHFDTPTPTALLVISLGGIAVQLVIGAALWLLLARGDSLARRLGRGAGGALVIHAGWYFATGLWHGYGDGTLAYRAVGDARYPIAILVGLGTCAVAFAVARLVLGALAASLPGSRNARIAGVIVAALLAGGIQAGLALGEVAVRGDSTYGAIMKPERERMIARELAAWQRTQQRPITDAERAAQERAIADRHHREPPFAPLLAVLLLAAVAVGAARARPAADPLRWRHVAIAGAIAAGTILAVMTIDAVFH